MSVSIHMVGKTVSDAKQGLIQHMTRKDEESGNVASRNSKSFINPELSKYNVELLPFVDDPMKKIKSDWETIHEKRKEAGLRKAQENKGVFLTSTLQLSDETLERLGWLHTPEYLDAVKNDWSAKRIKAERVEKWLPVNEQSDDVVKRVRIVYKDLLNSVRKQPKIYGDVLGAYLHMDESSPHVDLIQNTLDTSDFDFEHSGAYHFTNGKRGKHRRGEKLSQAQDHLMDHTAFAPNIIESYDLKRGERVSERKDLVKTVRVVQSIVDEKDIGLSIERDILKMEKTELEAVRSKMEDEKKRIEEERELLEEEKKRIETLKAEAIEQGKKEGYSDAIASVSAEFNDPAARDLFLQAFKNGRYKPKFLGLDANGNPKRNMTYEQGQNAMMNDIAQMDDGPEL